MSWCVYTRQYLFPATAAEITNHNTEETQPCFKLLCDDPYKSVSVTQRRCSKRYPCLENSLWRHMLRAHRAARLGGNELILSLRQIFFCLNCGMWYSETPQLLSFNLEASPLYWPDNLSSCPWLWANQYWNLFSVLISCAAVTHQGGVVQESRGEVTVEAEREDVSFSGAESHFVFWKG